MAPDDEVMSSLVSFTRDENISGASITGIGAFRDAVLQYFDWDAKVYRGTGACASNAGAGGDGDAGAPAPAARCRDRTQSDCAMRAPV